MCPFTFSRFVYCDTNILSHLATNQQLWRPLFRFLTDNDLCIALAEGNLLELAEAHRLHSALTALLVSVPSALIKLTETVINEEVSAHPRPRTDSLLHYPINAVLAEPNGRHIVLDLLRSPEVRRKRREQVRDAEKMAPTLARVKGNYSPSKSGRYERYQAEEYASFITIQWLASTHYAFMRSFKEDVASLNTDVFLSIRLFALVTFYKHYMGQREPKRSDFGDTFHLSSIPYCRMAIMERDLCNILQQIKRNHRVLDRTHVTNIDFVTDLA